MVYDCLKISQIVYNYAAGFGLFFAGIWGIRFFIRWIFEVKKKIKDEKITKMLKKRYPLKDFKKTFELIKVENLRPVYILDKETKFKIWIDSPQRLYDLGFDFDDVRRTTKAEVDSYEKEKISY